MNPLQQALADERRRQREAASAFINAVRASDNEAASKAASELWAHGRAAWRRALRGIVDANPSPEFRNRFVGFWVLAGDMLRDDAADDPLVLAALRALLPAYHGPDRTLYRGESIYAWRRRRHGMAWTTDLDVARAFADESRRNTNHGGVVLRSVVPGSAIIAEIDSDEDQTSEFEFIVDRRGLGKVEAIERLLPLPPALP
jgi:hypothetical protein